MGNLVVVGISDQQVAVPSDHLITYALGSCVGICLYDKLKRVSGLAHILLPESNEANGSREVYKYADTAIEALVKAMERQGSSRLHVVAKIAGGANMFINTGISIGDRNVAIVKRELNRLNIRLVAEDTGANYGRTVEFSTDDGTMIVKTIDKGHKVF
jgi:chemotaxis protein CheD